MPAVAASATAHTHQEQQQRHAVEQEGFQKNKKRARTTIDSCEKRAAESSCFDLTHAGVVHHFLRGMRLRKVFAHLCNHASGQATDPISDVAYTMLTCPVQVVISEVGVALFKGHQDAIYPFSEMDMGQRYFAERIVVSCMDQHQRLQEGSSAVQQQQPQPAISLACEGHGKHNESTEQWKDDFGSSPMISSKVLMQMGGGCVILTELPGASCLANKKHAGNKGGVEGSSSLCSSKRASLVEPSEVFEALCDCVFASKRYGDARVRYAVCSIIMQRVVGMAFVSREEQQRAYTYALRKLEQAEAHEEEEQSCQQ